MCIRARDNTMFSYIPNTAEVAFGGLVEGIDEHINKSKATDILKMGAHVSEPALSKILSRHPRIPKVVLKDAKQRTFTVSYTHLDAYKSQLWIRKKLVSVGIVISIFIKCFNVNSLLLI